MVFYQDTVHLDIIHLYIMIEQHSIESFLTLRKKFPILDVRSPCEFAKGHMAGAHNLPLLSDEEREQVGTAHAQSGYEAAIHVALQRVGCQLASKLEQARHLTRNQKEVLLYCWRGGMRSASMAWLLETGGFRVHRLEGGYKQFRQHIQTSLAQPRPIIALGGMTGCGKTDILHELAQLGSQVIDLEGLSGHKGSAFGGIGLAPQPNNETVENALFEQWQGLDPSRPVWMEDENRRIGTVTLPKDMHTQLVNAPLVIVHLSAPLRVERLVRMYTEQSKTDLDAALICALQQIENRLGNERYRNCIKAVQQKAYAAAVTIVLDYYDKAYQYQLERSKRQPKAELICQEDTPKAAAARLQAMERAFFQP